MERCLVAYCAETLAGIKTGSLFTCHFESDGCARRAIRDWNRILSDRGVALLPLRLRGGCALIYVYRRKLLQRELEKPEVAALLTDCEYGPCAVCCALRCLRSRMKNTEEFPHEIGVFLGYPIEDVRGFIENQGRNCLCTGVWKVYGDRSGAEKTFRRYRRCRQTYMSLWQKGMSIRQLTVAG